MTLQEFTRRRRASRSELMELWWWWCADCSRIGQRHVTLVSRCHAIRLQGSMSSLQLPLCWSRTGDQGYKQRSPPINQQFRLIHSWSYSTCSARRTSWHRVTGSINNMTKKTSFTLEIFTLSDLRIGLTIRTECGRRCLWASLSHFDTESGFLRVLFLKVLLAAR